MRKSVSLFAVLALLAALPVAGQFSTNNRKKKKKRVQPVNVSGIVAGPVTMETVNQRWAGKQALIRVGAFVEKGRDKLGWSYSKWAKSPELPGERPIEFRLGVSNRDMLLEKGYLYRKKALRAGTAFVADRWDLSMPEKGKGLHLKLKFEGLPVDAVLELKKDKLEDLEDAERAMRIQIFQLTGLSDEAEPPAFTSAPLNPSPAPRTAAGTPPPDASNLLPRPTAAVASRGIAAPEPSGQTTFKPAVEILAVSVQPAEATPGGEVNLVVQYRVDGLPAGFAYEVSETRRILVNDAEATAFEDAVSRSVGSFTSAQAMSVPADAPAGFYTFEATVQLAGVEASGTAFFRVER